MVGRILRDEGPTLRKLRRAAKRRATICRMTATKRA
jgi:hypothetical protein